MGEKKLGKKIFEYLDYREFLKDYYSAKKEANPAFSLRVFSDKIGFKAKDFISRVMNGDKNLSSASIPKVASGLRLGKHETEFFVGLVKFNQAETMDERNAAFEEMQAALKVVRFSEKQHILGHTQYMVYSHWRHLIIRSLIGMFGFDGDYEALAKMVHPHVTADEAKKSVKLLEECELIKKDSIDRDPPGSRHVSGLTLGISQEGYERIVERINAFRKEIALIAEEDKNSDKVFQLQFALFPVGGK